MKLLLAGILIVLCTAVANSTEIIADNNETQIIMPGEDGFVAVPVTSVRAKLEVAKDSVDAMEKLFDIFNSDLFDKTPLKVIAEIIAKVLSFVSSIINFFMGRLEPDESAEMKFLREQFAEVNTKLDLISLQIEDVKKLIEWESARNMYAQYEIHIKAVASNYDDYLTSAEYDREHRKRLFIVNYERYPEAAKVLYQAIVDNDFVIGKNLGTTVVHYTKNHQRQVMNFLLAMQRLIMRGAQMDIAYQKLVHCDGAGRTTEFDWKIRLEKLLTRMKEIDTQVRDKWHEQMKIDVDYIYMAKRPGGPEALTNEQFVGYMHRFLAEKYHWRHWFSLAYGPVHGYHLHTFSECGGHHRFREQGRNIVVASYDPKTSRFNTANANWLLAQAETAGHQTQDASVWYHEIDRRIGGGCDQVAFRGTVCWGCGVWWSTPRHAYRRITVGKYMINAILVG